MNYNRKFILYYFLPLVLFIVLIIYMSSQRNIATDTVIPDNYIKNAAHFLEYTFLTILAFRFFKRISRRFFIWTVVFVVLFAIGDEVHQYFVPTRTASVYDLLFDYLGLIAGLIISKIILIKET